MRSSRLLMMSLLLASSLSAAAAADQKEQPDIGFLGFTADGRQILTFGSKDESFLWELGSRKRRPIRKEDKKRTERIWLASVGRREPRLTCACDEAPFRFGILPLNHFLETQKTARLLACSADGKRLLLARRKDRRLWLIVRDQESGKALLELPQKEVSIGASLSPDGRTLAVTSKGSLIFLDLESGRKSRHDLGILTRERPFAFNLLKFSPDGSRVAVNDLKGKVLVVSVRDGRLLRTIPTDGIVELAFSADGKTLCLDDAPTQTLWEVASGQRIRTWAGLISLFSPGRGIFVYHNTRKGGLYDLYSGKVLRSCMTSEEINPFFAFSPDGRRFAISRPEGTILVWDAVSPESIEKPIALDDRTLERLWIDLETSKAAIAYPVMGRLIAHPHRTLPFLRKRLPKAPVVEENHLRQWIADLDSDSFDRREAASRELRRFGRGAEPALRKARTGAMSLEMRRRITELLRPFEAKEIRLSPEELAHVRAIQVLEGIGTAEARQLLKLLAEGAEGVTRTREAQEALQRIRQRGQ